MVYLKFLRYNVCFILLRRNSMMAFKILHNMGNILKIKLEGDFGNREFRVTE